LSGRRVADLYAGSGAVGLEALSRGASAVVLVESDPASVRSLRANVDAVGLPGAEVVAGRVERVVSRPPAAESYDLVFADPPYDLADDDLRAVLAAAAAHEWLSAGALVVVERATRGGDWRWPAGVDPLRSRSYGEATLWYGRAGSPLQPDGE
jgi:16S rRNA (guanine966-N2)-methyltransferase